MLVRVDHRSALLALWVTACTPAAPPVFPGTPPPPAPASAIAPETEPVATVDGVPIDLATFNARYRARMPNLRAVMHGHEALTALRLKRAVLDEMIDEALIARAAAERGMTGDPGALLDALLGPDLPSPDPTVAARRHAAREAALLAELRAAATIENPFAARTAGAFAGTGKPVRIGAGFAAVQDQIPADLPTSTLGPRRPE